MRRIFTIVLLVFVAFSGCKKDNKKGSIVGVLKLESGEILSFSQVILKSDAITIQQVFTDENGIFVFNDVNAGSYSIIANSDKYKTSKPVELVLTDGETYQFDCIFSPIISVSGYVSLGGVPFPTAQIELYDNQKVEQIDETNLDLESNFEFYNIQAGVYYLKITVSKETIYSIYGYLWNGSTWVWGPFDIDNFVFQDVYYPVEINDDTTREVVLNITWNGSAFVVNS